MDIDKLKEELKTDIQQMAQELARCETFTGLLSYEIKFKHIQEKFQVLKFLERKRIGNEIFDEIGPSSIKKIEESDHSERVKRSVENEKKEAENKPKDVEKVELNKIEDSQESESFKSKKAPLPLFSDMMKERLSPPTIEKPVTPNGKEKSETAVLTKEPKPLRLDLNDHLAFLNKLFKKDPDTMDVFFNELKECRTMSDSEQLLAEYAEEYGWKEDNEFLSRLKELNAKRFEA